MTDRRHQLRTIDDASPAGEGGLLGLAVTADEQTVFAYFTSAQDNRIVSMSWDGTTLGEPKPILTGIPKGGRHNGGRIVVGPDGDLYVGTGETGDTEPRPGQDFARREDPADHHRRQAGGRESLLQ